MENAIYVASYDKLQRYYYETVKYRYLNDDLFVSEIQYADALLDKFKDLFERCPLAKSIILDRLEPSEVEDKYSITPRQFQYQIKKETDFMTAVIEKFEDKYYNTYMEG